MFEQFEKLSASDLEKALIKYAEDNRKHPNIINDIEEFIKHQSQTFSKIKLLKTIYNHNLSLFFARNHASELNLNEDILHKAISLSISNHSFFNLKALPSYYGVMNNYYLTIFLKQFADKLQVNTLAKKHYTGKNYDKHTDKFKIKNIDLGKDIEGRVSPAYFSSANFQIGCEKIEFKDEIFLDSSLNLLFYYNDSPQFAFSFVSTDKNTVLINQIQMFNLVYSSNSTKSGQLFRFKDSNSFDWKNLGIETIIEFIKYADSKCTTIERIGILGHKNNIWFKAKSHRFTKEQIFAFKKNYDFFATTLGMKKEPDNNYYMMLKP